MNSNNQFTKMAIEQNLVLGQIANELIEINREVTYSQQPQLESEKTFLEALRDDLLGLLKLF
jgi:hypothetical protein